MEESSYKHNYEYLSIEEAKAIVNGTFVQGTTSIGGELATKSNIDKLLTAADKRLSSMVPSTVADNEFVCFFECVNNRVDPTGVHVTNIIIQVGQNQKIQYELTPSNATVDTCTYEITSGSEYVHITDGVVYADAVGEAVCKITINGTIESVFAISVINGNAERHYGDVFIMRRPGSSGTVFVDFHSPEYCFNPSVREVYHNNYMVYPKTYVAGIDTSWSGPKASQFLIDVDQIRKTYQQIKNKPSLIKGKTIEQACQIHGGHYVYVYFYANNLDIDTNTVRSVPCRVYKKSSGSSITFDTTSAFAELNGYTATGDAKNINYIPYGNLISLSIYGGNSEIIADYPNSTDQKHLDYFLRCATLFSFIIIDLDSDSETSVFDFMSFNDGYFEKGYNFDSETDTAKELQVDITTNSLKTDGNNVELNITVNKINNSTNITFLRSIMFASTYSDGYTTARDTLCGTDENGAFFYNDGGIKLPYTTQINIPKNDVKKIKLYMCAYDTENNIAYKTSAPIKEIVL